ncbi:NAD(P)-binding protein [Pluteus cervinus]|uniref:NAD(P)-binding protein n=1 Tax=Pluteus cervinus TaxID=181527 RepID=A0ACD3BE69_9AGAR|nr:NAD(P)-binding protein [Pluteus cervinus]
MSTYKSFAVAGVGVIGQPIVEALLASKVSVVALTRSSSRDNLPNGAKAATVDYSDVQGIAKALKDHKVEVLISTLSSTALGPEQISLADAAKEAGVKLFVPSEFGVPTIGRREGMFGLKAGLIDQLQKHGIPTIRIFNGWFTDGILVLTGYSANKKVSIVGKGDTPISFTSRADIAGFLAHVLTTYPPEKLDDKVFRIEGDRATLLELAVYLKAEVEFVDEVPGPRGPAITYMQRLLETGAGSTGWDPISNEEGSEKAGSGNAWWVGHRWQRIPDVVKV